MCEKPSRRRRESDKNASSRSSQRSDSGNTRGRGRPRREGRSGNNSSTQNLCRSWQATGTCRFGNGCRFVHGPSPGASSTANLGEPASLAQASEDVGEFMRRVVRTVQKNHHVIKLDNPRDLELWQQSWTALGVGAELRYGEAMVKMLMRLPASNAVMPRCDDVVSALEKVSEFVINGNGRVVQWFEAVADVMEFRLLRREGSVDEERIARLKTGAHRGLLAAIGDARVAQRASTVLCRVLALLERYAREVRCEEEDVEEEEVGWMGWRKATLGWLQKGSWLGAPPLKGEYENVEEYVETLRQFMTMLTFYWGAGAVFPKCRQRGHDDRPCDQPLFGRVGTNKNITCGRRLGNGQTCTRTAKWKCTRGGHDVCCEKCLRGLQALLVGEPGQRASTDVYDAVVERETLRRGGIVYVLSGLKSRKPPAINPNWRTTYRLNCSALVGVVRLGASCERLKPDSAVEWAEVVPVNVQEGGLGDYAEREKGRLALRLLTKADLSSLQRDAEILQVGSRLAIIDLQVFVPEVVSVLSTLADASLFEHLRDIPFRERLIGRTGEIENVKVEGSVLNVVRQALEETEIDVVQRLASRRKEMLCAELGRLAVETNLYGTQLESFAAALKNSLHCTQGPPGTGKSYLGVVLIQALDIIRRYAEQVGIAVGPIVVLSYKNHALDEVLVDVLNSKRPITRIIRCGKPEDDRLIAHVERTGAEERRAQEQLGLRVSCLRNVRRAVRDLRALRSACLDETGTELQDWRSSRKDEGAGITAVMTWISRILRLSVALTQTQGEMSSEQAYVLLDRMVQPTMEMKESERREVLALLKGLEKGMEHWLGTGCRASFLLLNWLTGCQPPPRCQAEWEGGCIMPSAAPGAYCYELHDCKYPNGCNLRREEGLLLCKEHRCQSDENCKLPRLPSSEVCEVHVCAFCVRSGRQLLLRKVGEACEEHSCRVGDCPAMFFGPILPYCREHCCRACGYLSRIDPGQVKSVLVINGSRFCREHKCEVERCPRNRLIDGENEQLYCREHVCVKCVGIKRCVDSAFPLSRLCKEHRCAHVDRDLALCGSSKEDRSNFCEEHTCRFCRAEGNPLDKPVTADAPRNVCADHPLCTNISYDGTQCNKRAFLMSSEYCEVHLKPSKKSKGNVQCEGITSKRRRCKTTGVAERGSFYCFAHFDQRPDSESEEELPEEDEADEDDETMAEDAYEEDMDNWSLEADQEDNTDTRNSEEQMEFTDEDVPIELSGDTERGEKNFPVQEAKITTQGGADLELTFEEPRLPTEQLDKVTVDKEESRAEDADPNADVIAPAATLPAVSDGEENERVAFNACPDEIDFESDESVSSEAEVKEEMPDQMQHLRDIVGSDSSGSDTDSEDDNAISDLVEDPTEDKSGGNPGEWSWQQAPSERWRRVANFVADMCGRIAELALLADVHVENARRERAEAAAYSFKRARVIGATVVGATRRLHALRASEPFAMVVEEACEVMEPTLVSVLSVSSLRKLELIGDHRQLPAFVQPCWFNLQTTHPSIKVSLFERIVQNDSLTCTVLDVQRRMRPEICELTRSEYKDVIQIEDHDCTISQRIADRYIKDRSEQPDQRKKVKAILEERKLWRGEGNLVPGIKPQVFFWDLQTKEGRAAVGLSRCNNGEAEACVGLLQWLVQCGVPASCITVITPFKGQKLTILRQLRNIADTRVRGAVVSTVDRYQGDENDIVILSLVSTRPGNRFVALRNRFIVSTSRARIGFYIIGSSGAVGKTAQGNDGPLHWRRLLKDLQQSSAAVDKDHNNTEIESDNRIGSKLTICCPRHVEVSREVSSASQLPITAEDWAGFCGEQCPFILPWCGHRCEHKCHSRKIVPHTSECQVHVQRPCENHAHVPLRCSEAHRKDSSGAKSLTLALQSFQCDVKVEYHRDECPHSVQLRCHEQEALLAGEFELSECIEVVEDYYHPACGHVWTQPKCFERRRWEENPPSCQQLVVHQRSCGCRARMSCHNSIQESSLSTPPACLEAVLKPRPRCSHPLSSRCFEATLLRELWEEQDGEAVGYPLVVAHGERYGPAETELGTLYPHRLNKEFSPCHVKTEYRRSCGHIITVRCSDAFDLASGSREEGLCAEEVTFKSPICGHMINGPCSLRSMCEEMPQSIFVNQADDETGDIETVADESSLDAAVPMEPWMKKLCRLCKGSFVVMRACGHKSVELRCSSQLYRILSRKQLPTCETNVTVGRSCGHAYSVQCHRRGDPPPECFEPIDELFKYPLCVHNHSVRPGTCTELTQLRALENPTCPIRVTAILPRCKHLVEVPCHLEKSITTELPGTCIDASHVVEEGIDYCDPAPSVEDCHELVRYRRQCGHEEDSVHCSLAFQWAAAPETATPCEQPIEVSSPLCEHSVQIDCCHESRLVSITPWGERPAQRITITFDGNEELTCPVAVEDEHVPEPLPDDMISLLKCGRSTRLQRICGHSEDVPCETIYDALNSQCKRLELYQCERCGHERPVPCYQLASDSIALLCKNVVTKNCSVCNINSTEAECYKEKPSCKKEVLANLSCGHEVRWTCGDEDPREKIDSEPCLFCIRQTWLRALETARLVSKNLLAKSTEKPASSSASTGTHNDSEIPFFDWEGLVKDLVSEAQSILPSSSIKACHEVGPFDARLLIEAYTAILEQNIDLFSQAIENESREGVLVQKALDVSTVESYDIVYTIASKKSALEKTFKPVDTQYGFGIRATLLSMEAIVEDCIKKGKDGTISIFIAAALKHHALTGTEPFRPQRSVTKQNFKKNDKKGFLREVEKADRKARQLMQRYVQAGYDHVCRSETDQAFQRVYWIRGAVVPLVKMDLELYRTCGICLDGSLPSKGWSCPEDHFLCRDCFNAHAQQAKAPDALARTVDKTGNLLCPHDGCEAKFESLSLLSQQHDATDEELRQMFIILQDLRMSSHARREVTVALEQQKLQLQAEFQRIQQIQDLVQRQAETLKLHITDDILTLRCPVRTCRMAFLDFEGCFALTCSACKIQFCAWCINHHSRVDVHAHVASCPEGSSFGVFHNKEVFREHHRLRKKRLIIEKLRKEKPEVQERALQLLATDLRDLRIEITANDLSRTA